MNKARPRVRSNGIRRSPGSGAPAFGSKYKFMTALTALAEMLHICCSMSDS